MVVISAIYTTNEALVIDSGGTVSTVKEVQCLVISDNVFSFADGKTTSWVFKETASTLTEIDFRHAINLQRIGSYAFYYCEKVTKFDLSPCFMLSYVGIGAFQCCSGATEIIFPESPLENIPGGCFSYCKSLKTFNVPPNIKCLDNDKPDNMGIFLYCTSLKNVTFSQNSQCTKLKNKVFWDSGVEVIYIPEKLEEINGWTFRCCPSLIRFEVDEKNKNFCAKNGALYTKDNKLIYYPQNALSGDTAKIAEGTVAILNNAFSGVDSYKYVSFPESSLTELYYNAFYDFASLVSITIPASVTKMGSQLFYVCNRLKNVTYLNSPLVLDKYSFYSCSSVSTFNIPKSVTTLGDYLFSQCRNLIEVYIPRSVATFGTGVFGGCSSSLKLIFESDNDYVYESGYLYNKEKTRLILYFGDSKGTTVIDTINIIDASAFMKRSIETITFENSSSIKSIGSYAFQGCTSLKSIDLPDIETIEEYIFNGCTSLTSVIIPASVKTIKQQAFNGCNKLSEIQIKGDLKTIEKFAFYSCSKLSECVLPNSVSSIGESAFGGCSSLSEFKLPKSLITIGQNAFSNSGITSFTFDDNTDLDTITTLAINNCNRLTSFKTPNSVSCFSGYAISSCSNLQSISLSSKLSRVENYAISDCPQLEEIIIGDNDLLYYISSLAFYNCPKLVRINTEGSNHFSFDNGMLFNEHKTSILLFLKAVNPRIVVIPETVSNIFLDAFSGCASIENVTIKGNGLVSIEMSAFQDCTSLKYINFPSSLSVIGTDAFTNCNIKTVSLLNTEITELRNGVFSNNKRLSLVFLPACFNKCASNAFENTGKNLILFYHGNNTILNAAGLKKSARVFCFDGYMEDIFLGLPVRTSYSIECSLNRKQSFHNNDHLSLVLLLVLCY